MITPFIGVYTKGVHDVNYIRPIFGYLICASVFSGALTSTFSGFVTTTFVVSLRVFSTAQVCVSGLELLVKRVLKNHKTVIARNQSTTTRIRIFLTIFFINAKKEIKI